MNLTFTLYMNSFSFYIMYSYIRKYIYEFTTRKLDYVYLANKEINGRTDQRAEQLVVAGKNSELPKWRMKQHVARQEIDKQVEHSQQNQSAF